MSTSVQKEVVQSSVNPRVGTTIAAVMDDLRNASCTASTGTAFSTLHEPMFRRLWIAAVISFTGSWMHTVAAGWLMTTMSMCPFRVSMVQAASVMPVFLVILPAGAIADMADRRKLLLITQSWMAFVAATLGFLTLARVLTPNMLIVFTFLLGLGAVINDPAWQAITTDLVHPKNLEQAVALNSTGFNVARAIGPAIGGFVIMLTCSGWVFLINAASFFAVIFVIYTWKSRKASHGENGPVWTTMIEGLAYLVRMPGVRSVLVRTAVFSISACALTALMPVLAHPYGSSGYGLLLGCFGAGALIGAALLPTLRRVVTLESVVIFATLLFAAAMATSASWPRFAVLAPAILLAGVAWLQVIAALNVSAQTMSPPHMRARAISIYLLVLQGGMAIGSAGWGYVAREYKTNYALLSASLLLSLGLLSAFRYRVRSSQGLNVAVAAD
jgi:MFS family permease